MDEARTVKMDTTTGGGAAKRTHPLPNGKSSAYEVFNDATGSLTTDPTRAHEAAGDPGFEQWLPSCHSCQAQALAEAEAQAQEQAVKSK